MTNTPEQAIAHALDQSAHGPRFNVGECLRQVRTAFGVASDGTPDASTAWERAKVKHPTDDVSQVPRGALAFWTGGSHGHGHIAIGAGHGRMVSTDILRPGYFDLADLDLVRSRWGLTFVGWAPEVDGVRVWTPPKHPAHPLVQNVLHAAPGPDRVAAMRVLAAKGSPRAAAQARVWLRADFDKHRTLDALRKIATPS